MLAGASISSKEFWDKVSILISDLMAILANAFPVNTFFLMMKGSKLAGNATTAETYPAFSLADNLGAMAFPELLFDKMIIFDPSFYAT